MMPLTLWPRLELGGSGTTGENANRVMWKPCFVRVCSTFAVNLGSVCAAVSLFFTLLKLDV